jgi:hypothetical protein
LTGARIYRAPPALVLIRPSLDIQHSPTSFEFRECKRSRGTPSGSLSGLHTRPLASACPVKCEAYFTGAAPCKRFQLSGLNRIGLRTPVNGCQTVNRCPSTILLLPIKTGKVCRGG